MLILETGWYVLRNGGKARVIHIDAASQRGVEGMILKADGLFHRHQNWTYNGRWFADGVGFEHPLDLVEVTCAP